MTVQTLAQALQDQHETAMIRRAATIRDWRLGPERIKQAEIHVRTALWEQGIGRIGQATQYRIYSILDFVMPEDAAFESEPSPLGELAREADLVAAYYEQLERQSCPECGDGVCRSP